MPDITPRTVHVGIAHIIFPYLDIPRHVHWLELQP